MPRYAIRLFTADKLAHLPEYAERANFHEALIAANGKARAMVHRLQRHTHGAVRGWLDLEDEDQRPVARIFLADVARQIS